MRPNGTVWAAICWPNRCLGVAPGCAGLPAMKRGICCWHGKTICPLSGCWWGPACLQAGVRSNGATEFAIPTSVRMPLEDLRRWSRVLQAGIAAETLIYGAARGGADDRALLGRLWGLSGHDVDTAQREQRRARREVDQWLRAQQKSLEQLADELLSAPVVRPSPQASAD